MPYFDILGFTSTLQPGAGVGTNPLLQSHRNQPHRDGFPPRRGRSPRMPATNIMPTAPSSTCISPPLLPEGPRAAPCTLHAHLQVCRGEASPKLGSSPQRASYTTTAQIYHQQLSGGIWGETASAAFRYQDNFHFHFLACWCLACCQHGVSAQQARLARTTAAGGFLHPTKSLEIAR